MGSEVETGFEWTEGRFCQFDRDYGSVLFRLNVVHEVAEYRSRSFLRKERLPQTPENGQQQSDRQPLRASSEARLESGVKILAKTGGLAPNRDHVGFQVEAARREPSGFCKFRECHHQTTCAVPLTRTAIGLAPSGGAKPVGLRPSASVKGRRLFQEMVVRP